MPKLNIVFQTKPSVRLQQLGVVATLILISYGWVLTGTDPVFNSIWRALLILCLGYLGYVHLDRWFTSYAITDEDVRVSRGIIARRTAVAQFKRITNVATEQSILERLCGEISLYVDTAGKDVEEVSFRRMSYGDAEEAGLLIRKILHKQEDVQPELFSESHQEVSDAVV